MFHLQLFVAGWVVVYGNARDAILEAFDAIRIDCLNGDKYKTGKVTPDGTPDPSIFSTPSDPVGIQVGTAIATLVRKADHAPSGNHWLSTSVGTGETGGIAWKRRRRNRTTLYDAIEPVLPLGLPLVRTAVSAEYFDWPTLPELFPVSFPGVKTSRDGFLVDTDLDRLKARISDYFNADVSHEEMTRRYPGVMKATARFDARAVRDTLLARGGPVETGFVRYAYRPFDNRWLYWEGETKLIDEKRADYKRHVVGGNVLLDRPRPDYRPHVFGSNVWLVAQQKPRRDWSPPQVLSHIGCLDLMDRGATCIPTWLRDDSLVTDGSSTKRRPNLSAAAQRYLKQINASVEDLFHHILAVLHDPTYREANAGALRMDWPRIPLPGWPTPGSAGILPASDAAQALAQSAARGRQLAALLDPDTPVPGVTTGTLRPDIASIAVPATVDGRNMDGDDFALTAGWGHYGTGDAVMPGQGRVVERDYTADERTALE